MSELRDWLRRHRFEQYAEIFEANDIDLDILPELSEPDLEQLGVSWAIGGDYSRRSPSEASPAELSDAEDAELRATPSGARSRCCSATWSAPRRCPARSIPSFWAR